MSSMSSNGVALTYLSPNALSNQGEIMMSVTTTGKTIAKICRKV